MSASLQLRGLSRRYGTSLAVDDMTLDVAPGELVVLLGPSGCGKTTTLRMVAGFIEPSGGDIVLDGQSIVALPPHRREMGIVFQSYALFPHLSVARNVAFGLEMRGDGRARRDARVAEMLRLVKLEPFADRLPKQLSGGQQQRVAIARALAIRPRVLLLDEPLSNLDAALRHEVAREMRIMQRDSNLTTIMVTHDQDEAMAMADRLVVMDRGRVRQAGTPEEVYERPADLFVAGFIGRCNSFGGTVEQPGRFRAGCRTLPCDGGVPGQAATLIVRPERV
ncbi:MAG: ABC transporter ATP-binding protein, partial [Gemmatimonadaceae bacterium]|nr:ABC transporter ATP-binding protein [Acetobacteraceae bacterium]